MRWQCCCIKAACCARKNEVGSQSNRSVFRKNSISPDCSIPRHFIFDVKIVNSHNLYTTQFIKLSSSFIDLRVK